MEGRKATPYPYGPLVGLLLLDSRARNEASDARSPEFNLDKALWLAQERFKSNKVHHIPLSGDAVALLTELPRWQEGDHVLLDAPRPRPHRRVQQGEGAPGRTGAGTRELGREPEPWVNTRYKHASGPRLSKLKVPYEIAELVIGHARQGLDAVYDQHELLDERRDALERSATMLRSIVELPPRTSPTSRRSGGRGHEAPAAT